DVDRVLYSLISLFIIGRVVDLVQVGFDRSKNVMIISEVSDEVNKMIIEKMDRGVTHLAIQGGFERREKEMLMCVIPEKEFHTLKEEVLAID
ncbi:YitT family protein, partial [[Eubacterium] rectale]